LWRDQASTASDRNQDVTISSRVTGNPEVIDSQFLFAEHPGVVVASTGHMGVYQDLAHWIYEGFYAAGAASAPAEYFVVPQQGLPPAGKPSTNVIPSPDFA